MSEIISRDIPYKIYTSQQVKVGEKELTEKKGLEMYTLMKRAGQAVYALIQLQYPSADRILVFCGNGNNGGDAFVVATLAKLDGRNVSLVFNGQKERLSEDGLRAYQEWIDTGGDITEISEEDNFSSFDLIVDGLLGTGISGKVRPQLQNLISKINHLSIPIVSIDVPSGLCSDTGGKLGEVIKSDHTVSFIGVKRGLLTGYARNYVGELFFAGLGIEDEFQRCYPTNVSVLSKAELLNCLPKREFIAHKGTNGRLLCLGGNSGYSGAINLCSRAAARTGTGLIKVLCHKDSSVSLQVSCPEVMTQSWCGDNRELRDALLFADVVALGPGMGRDQWAKQLYMRISDVDKPKVLDADALYFLSLAPNKDPYRILTPHPGEAAMLLGLTVKEIEQDRFSAVHDLHEKYGGVIVLKGAGTLIYDGHFIYICNAGSPAMASGGMGDILTGIVSSLLAQGQSLIEAAKTGVLLHSVAADQISKREGPIGLLAGDVIQEVRQVMNLWLSESSL